MEDANCQYSITTRYSSACFLVKTNSTVFVQLWILLA